MRAADSSVQLPIAWAALLVVAGVWNLVVWPRFLQRVAKDPRARDAAGRRTAFYRVHLVLVAVSLVLGVAVAALGVMALV